MGDVDSSHRVAVARSGSGGPRSYSRCSLLVLFVLGTWNPVDLVVLWRYGRNPLLGAVLVFALALVASWLVAPIDNEARQAGRARCADRARRCLLFAQPDRVRAVRQPVHPDYRVVARRPTARGRSCIYDPGTDFQRLHVWTGVRPRPEVRR